MAANREYKSDVFSMLMEDSGRALSLYNAMNGSSYEDPELVEKWQLENGISLSVRNDASFILDMNLSIYEHQSTVCPNIPVRSLIYFANILEKWLKGKNIYGRKAVKIPTPRFAVFYNGGEEQPETYTYRLSDLFEHPVEDPELELRCKVYNINFGKNVELLDKCPFLKEYMTFVDYVRMFYREYDYENLERAIDRAIDRCIQEEILKDFFLGRRAEVLKMMQLDYTFDRQITLEREDARLEGHAEGHAEGIAEGRAEGIAEGRAEGEMRKLIKQVCRKLAKGKTLETIAEELEETADGLKAIYDVAVGYAPDYNAESVLAELRNKDTCSSSNP